MKKKRIGLVFFWLFMVMTTGVAYGQSYYVAVDGSDDAGDGSETAPWATITHALDSVPDQSLILVKPGTYTGRIRLRGTFDKGVTVKSQIPYLAKLRNNATVVTCYYGRGITLEGFDIAHSGPGAGALVVQIQDLVGGVEAVSRITIKNNIWSDPSGSMGASSPGGASDFSDTPPSETATFTLDGNLYWNGEAAIPDDAGDLINPSDDTNRKIGDPLLGSQDDFVIPMWIEGQGRFADGSTTIRQAFVRLVSRYGKPANDSPAIDAATGGASPSEDVLGNRRPSGNGIDIGAVEHAPVILAPFMNLILAE